MNFIAMHNARTRERNRRLAVAKDRQRWEALHSLASMTGRVCDEQKRAGALVGRILTVVENWPR